MTAPKISNRENYLNTYSGRTLAATYPMNQKGLWQVRAGDTSCDFGVDAELVAELDLGVLSGTLSDVIDIAVEMDGFRQWGVYGSITPVVVAKEKPTTLTLFVEYALSGIKKDGSRVFYSIDSGYPYWTPNARNAATWRDLKTLTTILDQYKTDDVTRVEVLRVDTIGTVVLTVNTVSEEKQKALSEVAELERVLAEKMAEIGRMV